MATAPSTLPAQEQPRAAKPRTFVGSTMPYLAAAIFAAGVMAWYFFVYVPAKLDYFVGLRFRTLAVASAQVASKEENLFKALKGAVAAGAGKSGTVTRDVISGYFRALVPDMQFSREDKTGLSPENVPGLRLSLPAEGNTVGTTVAWEDVALAATEASIRDFDDLLLADKDGVVVWQREKATPRVDNLETLLNTETEPSRWFSFSWQIRPTRKKAQPVALPANPALSPVEVGGVPSYLFVQRVSLPKDGAVQLPTLYVGGLVSRRALERQATHIPVVWIVFVTLPVVLLFLALPFIKLASLMPKERYAFVDIAFLGLATIWAAGIGASLPFGPAGVTAQGDRRLGTAADAIEGQLALETRRVLNLARTIQDHEEVLKAGLDDCESRIEAGLAPKRCGLWNAVRGMKQQLATGVSERDLDEILGSLELDIVAWVNRDGQQVQKWTTKTVVTTLTSHRSFDHFRNLSLGHTWTLADEDQPRTLPRFTIDPLRSPTTAEMGFIFGVPATGASHHNQFFVLNVRPQSVVDPILPPGYGFAVLTQDGRVQFHSEEALSLKENVLEEVNNPGAVRTWLQSGHRVTWSSDYHGRPHRLHMRTMPAFVGCQWRIVVFREMEPVLAAQLRQQTGTLRLWSLNFLALLGVLGLIWWHSRASSRKVRDIALAPASPSRPAISALIGLTGLAAFLIAWTYRADALRGLDYLYVGFALIPLLAVGVAVVSRHWEPFIQRPIGARWSDRRGVVAVAAGRCPAGDRFCADCQPAAGRQRHGGVAGDCGQPVGDAACSRPRPREWAGLSRAGP